MPPPHHQSVITKPNESPRNPIALIIFSVSKLQSNPNIDLSKLQPTGIFFQVNPRSFLVIEGKTNAEYPLSTQEKKWRKTISGELPGGDTIKIKAVGKKKPIGRTHFVIELLIMSFFQIFKPKYRSRVRIVEMNGRRVGVLDECLGARRILGRQSLPRHCSLNSWETLYYDHSTKDVQIYHHGNLVGVAKYASDTYEVLSLDGTNKSLFTALAIASIDALDGR